MIGGYSQTPAGENDFKTNIEKILDRERGKKKRN